jgi:type I restriction enzyme S subunit
MREQARIVSVIDAFNERLEEEVKLLAKLKLQKKGLMHDLLTGKVRVKMEDPNEAVS